MTTTTDAVDTHPHIVHFYDSVIAEDQRDLPADLFAERWASVVAAITSIFDAFGTQAVLAARRPPFPPCSRQ